MYKLGMAMGAGMMISAVIMLSRSKRVTIIDLAAGGCMVAVIAIALSEIL